MDRTDEIDVASLLGPYPPQNEEDRILGTALQNMVVSDVPTPWLALVTKTEEGTATIAFPSAADDPDPDLMPSMIGVMMSIPGMEKPPGEFVGMVRMTVASGMMATSPYYQEVMDLSARGERIPDRLMEKFTDTRTAILTDGDKKVFIAMKNLDGSLHPVQVLEMKIGLTAGDSHEGKAGGGPLDIQHMMAAVARRFWG